MPDFNKMSDRLVEITQKELSRLRTLYAAVDSKRYVAYMTISNYMRWFEKEPNLKDITFFCLNDDFSDGTFVVIVSFFMAFLILCFKIFCFLFKYLFFFNLIIVPLVSIFRIRRHTWWFFGQSFSIDTIARLLKRISFFKCSYRSQSGYYERSATIQCRNFAWFKECALLFTQRRSSKINYTVSLCSICFKIQIKN